MEGGRIPSVDDAASTADDNTTLSEATNADNAVVSPHVTQSPKQGLPESSNPSGGDAVMKNVPPEASDKGKQIVATLGTVTRGVVMKENVHVEASNEGKVTLGFTGTGGRRKYDSDGYGARVLECQQGLSKIQQWESLFPGWKISPSTMQWYRVNNGHEALQGNAESVSSDRGTLDRNQSMTRAYPSDMLIFPNYPGWYYDTTTRDWKLLESYISSLNLSMDDSQNAVDANGVQGPGNCSRQDSNAWQHQTVVKNESAVQIQLAGSVNAASKSTMAISSMADSSRMNPIHTQSPNISTSPRQGQTDSSKKASSPESKVGTSFGFGLQQIRRTVGKVSRPKQSRQAEK